MQSKDNYEAGFSSDARKDPQRVVFITKKTSAKVKGEVSRQLMSYPHLLLREMIAFELLTIVLVVIALVWDAPLEQLANSLVTPNPAKAPWYFLGLQELLHYFPPIVAGILIPTLVIVGLVVIPYFNVNVEAEPLWKTPNRQRRLAVFLVVVLILLAFVGFYEAWDVFVPTFVYAGLAVGAYFARPQKGRVAEYWQSRPLSWWIMTWFITVALTLTLVGTFFRGPGWSLVWPGR
jgi:quinol---cytochrome c reductase cytochrome c subunit, bacillus type